MNNVIGAEHAKVGNWRYQGIGKITICWRKHTQTAKKEKYY